MPRTDRGPATRRGPVRRFTILDAMIGVAVASVALLFLRYQREYHVRINSSAIRPAIEVGLSASTILILIYRLRSPRPTLRRIARQPGATACFGVVALLVVFNLNWFVPLLIHNLQQRPGVQPISDWLWLLTYVGCPLMVAVIPITWAIQYVGRTGRAEAGWIDRSGRAVGGLWLIWYGWLFWL